MTTNMTNSISTLSDAAVDALSDAIDVASDTALDLGESVAAAATSPAVVGTAKAGWALLRRYRIAVVGAVVAIAAWRWWTASGDDDPANRAG